MSKSRSLDQFAWSALDIFVTQFITLIIGIVLARLLGPEDFGLIGMTTFFIALSQVLVTGGINDALIRRKDTEAVYYNTAFIFNLATSVLLYFVIFLSAPLIANFYREESLEQIVRVISITLMINGFALVQRARIIKERDFKKLALVNISAALLSGVIGIVLAMNDFGVWSLVWRTVFLSLFTLIVISAVIKWKPSFRFNKDAWQDMFSFGGKLMLLGVIDTIYRNIYLLIIGKYFSADRLGQYTRAESFKKLPAESLTSIIQRVSFPMLADLQDDKLTLRDTYRRLISLTMLISLTGMMFLAAISPSLITILLGDEWAETGTYLRLLCFSGMFYPLDALNSNILKVMNRSDIILKVGVWRKILAVPVILILIYSGIIPFLFSLILHQIVSYLLISNSAKSMIDYGTLNQLKDISSSGLIMFVVFGLLWMLEYFSVWTVSVLLALQVITGVLLIIILYFTTRNQSYIFLIGKLKDKFSS